MGTTWRVTDGNRVDVVVEGLIFEAVASWDWRYSTVWDGATYARKMGFGL